MSGVDDCEGDVDLRGDDTEEETEAVAEREELISERQDVSSSDV